MSQFVNYNKRSVKLPPGCKDLGDLLKPKSLRKAWGATLAAQLPVVTRAESVSGTLAELGQYVAALFEARAQSSVLTIGPPDEQPSITLCRTEGEELVAVVTFGKEAEQSMRAFFDRHGLQAPEGSETPVLFHSDLPVQLIYRISPLPAEAALLSKLFVGLLHDLRGLDDKSQLQFHYLEIGHAA